MANALTNDMTVGSPIKHIIKFTIPLLIGNIFQVLYNMVDTIIVGRTISVEALAAVGAAGAITFLIVGFALGFTNGLSIIVAQRFGANDMDGVRRSVGTGLILAAMASVVLTAVSMLSARSLLQFMHTPDNIINDSYNYIIVIYAGIVFQVFYNYISCVIRALGDSRTPLYFLLISSIINIILDLVFILNFQMGVAGAGLATIIAQAISGLLCLLYVGKKFPELHLKKSDFKWDSKFSLRHLGLAVPMAFQMSVTAIGVMIVQAVLNSFGSTVIAGYTAANKIEQLVSQPQISFGVTMATFVGQNYGAMREKRIREGVNKCALLVLGFTVIIVALVLIFSRQIAGIFIDSGTSGDLRESVTLYTQNYFYVAGVFYFALGLLFVYRNSLQGMGNSGIVLCGSAVELIARIVLSLVLANTLTGMFGEFYGYLGVCASGPIAWLSACTLFMISYFIKVKKLPEVFEKQRQFKEYDKSAAIE